MKKEIEEKRNPRTDDPRTDTEGNWLCDHCNKQCFANIQVLQVHWFIKPNSGNEMLEFGNNPKMRDIGDDNVFLCEDHYKDDSNWTNEEERSIKIDQKDLDLLPGGAIVATGN